MEIAGKRVAMIVANPCRPDPRVIKTARAMAQAGAQVTVFAVSISGTPEREWVDGVDYVRLPWNARKALTQRFFKRDRLPRPLRGAWAKLVPFTAYRLFAETFAPAICKFRPDVVHAHDLVTLPTGVRVKRACDAALIYDAHEIETGRFPVRSRAEQRFIRRVEGRCIRECDAVVTVCAAAADVFAELYGRDDAVVVHNAPVVGPSPTTIRDRIDAKGRTIVSYTGKIAAGRGLEQVVNSLVELPDLHFVATGPNDSAFRLGLDAMIRSTGLRERVSLLPPVPPDEVVGFIGATDICIVPTMPLSLSYEASLPNKLFEAMSTGRPIVASRLSEMSRVLAPFSGVRLYDPRDRGAMVRALEEAARTLTTFERPAAERAVIERLYGWPAQVDTLHAVYRALPERSAGRHAVG